MRVQDENKHTCTAFHRMLEDTEKDNLVIEKQRSDVEEKKLKIEGEKMKI